MKYAISLGYLIAAVINIAPSVGMLSNQWLQTLYGVDEPSGDLSLLLRHRAVLFLIVGVLLLFGAFSERLRSVTGVAGLVSMCSFIILYWLIPGTGSELQRVMYVDCVGIAALVIAMSLDLMRR